MFGAVAVIVNVAVPFWASPLDSVTAHVNNPVPVQFVTDVTPLPGVTPVAVTPLGKRSFTVAEVPDVV